MTIHFRATFRPKERCFLVVQLLRVEDGTEVDRQLSYITERAALRGWGIPVNTEWTSVEEGDYIIRVYQSESREALTHLLFERTIERTHEE
jgi:hypothetical protein